MEIRSQILAHVAELLVAKGQNGALEPGTSLVLSGMLDSMDVMNIALFIGEEFGVDFAEIGFDQYDFDTVDSISTLVEEVTQS